jgi:energy-coupling factor transporter ATP-binding protein EcfA2
MINIPVLTSLDITDYGLFPGNQDNPGMHVLFTPGLTLVLGANGLGKTTLITILYRMLTGPSDIPALAWNFPLGSASLRAATISSIQRSIFSQRVVDGAKNASARLIAKFGDHSVVIERRLRDLQLIDFQIDEVKQSPGEEIFQQKVSELVGVWSFGDWILLLRHIVFYFEDRRALVWDPTAQRQLLRFLFLPIEVARRWTEEERDILELDSQMRNLRAVVYKETRSVAAADSKAESAQDTLAEMRELDERQAADVAQREELDEGFADLESKRQTARHRMLNAEQERESRYRKLEHARLMAIEARFPDRSESARYILAQLMTSSECLFCGSKVPTIAAELESRISARKCLICGSDLAEVTTDSDSAGFADSQVSEYIAALQAIEAELVEARHALREAEAEYNNLIQKGAELDKAIAERTARLEELAKRLPPEEAERLKRHEELVILRRRVEAMQADLDTKRGAFKEFLQEVNRSLIAKAQDIQNAFNLYAKGFLFDDCDLTWLPRSERLGQSGEMIEFPAFQVDLGGSNFPSPVRRLGPQQVSESQREFIDLAFRMALMEVATASGVGTLVIDAPESSLDAVFSKRAAEVLMLFAQREKGNRLIVTSNLSEGGLIPDLIKLGVSTQDDERRIIDLFSIAEPTRATKEMETEYKTALYNITKHVGSNKQDESESDK